MRDQLNSTLPRHFLSELDEEYGIVDVSPILDAFYLPAAVVLDAAGAEIKLQNKFARHYVDGHLGRREAYLEMCLEVAETNDWRPADRQLRPCCWKTFLKRVAACRRAARGTFSQSSWSQAA